MVIQPDTSKGFRFDYWTINSERVDFPFSFKHFVFNDTEIVAHFKPLEVGHETNYSHVFDVRIRRGDNYFGNLNWILSMDACGDIETGSIGRGVRFKIAETDSHEMTLSTFVDSYTISNIAVEAAMGSANDTTMTIIIGGKVIVEDQPLKNTIATYTYDVPNLKGEVVITLKATAPDEISYIKSITINR